jgi:hypothetical protein
LGLAAVLSGWLALSPVAAAADVSLAGYEPSESTGLTLTSPDGGMTLTWPLAGGAAGVPAATEGSHVLRLDWSGETDRKVEVRHDWSTMTFDLAGHGRILIDVYIETPSALPAIAGIYDDVFAWIEGFDLPSTTGQWTTLSMCVADKQQIGLDHILATLFEDVAGDDGTLYLDNLRLAPPREIMFAGREWTVKCGGFLGPGPNPFSQGEGNVWVDGSGRLHLKISERRGQWWNAEVVLKESLGYGTYSFEVETNVDSLDENIVLGLFTYDFDAPAENFREIDIEFSKWGVPTDDNGQFVVQPHAIEDNIHRFDVDYAGAGGNDTTTHRFSWRPGAIEFDSSYGAIPPPSPGSIETWSYTGADIPNESDEEVRLNLWLFGGAAPANALDAEVVLSDFRFVETPNAVPALGAWGWGVLGLALACLGGIHRARRGRARGRAWRC